VRTFDGVVVLGDKPDRAESGRLDRDVVDCEDDVVGAATALSACGFHGCLRYRGRRRMAIKGVLEE
jgi:hypothetical protein